MTAILHDLTFKLRLFDACRGIRYLFRRRNTATESRFLSYPSLVNLPELRQPSSFLTQWRDLAKKFDLKISCQSLMSHRASPQTSYLRSRLRPKFWRESHLSLPTLSVGLKVVDGWACCWWRTLSLKEVARRRIFCWILIFARNADFILP
jgi:hypothetical protein